MPFSNQEKIENADKLSLQITGTANAPAGQKFWYNEDFAWSPIVPPQKLWNKFKDIPSATSRAEANANVTANPSFLESRTLRLTLDITSNNRAFIAREVFNNNESDVIDNWIQPSLIRTEQGTMSPGYGVALFHGDPDTDGTPITTTFEGGASGEPSWAFNYSSGIVIISTDKASIFRALYDDKGLYIFGYRYIGSTGGSGAGGDSNTLRGTGFPTPLTLPGNDNQFYLDDTYIDTKGQVINWAYHGDRNEWYPTACCWRAKYFYDDISLIDGVKLFVVGKKIEEVAIEDVPYLQITKVLNNDIDIQSDIQFGYTKKFNDDIDIQSDIQFLLITKYFEDIAIEDIPQLQINKVFNNDLDLTETITKNITKELNNDLEIIETILFIFFGNEINSKAINETGLN